MGKSISKNPRLTVYAWVVCSLAAVFYCYEYLLRIEPSVIMPQLMQNFAVNAAGLSLITAMYYYAYTPLQAVVGMLTDYFGPKRSLTSAISICVMGSLLFAYTTNPFVAGLARMLIGVGSAFAFVGVLKLATIWLPRNRFAMFAGITTGLGMIGAMAGDVGLTWSVQHVGWHYVLLYSALFGLILIPVFMFYVHEKKAKLGDKTHITLTFSKAIAGLANAFRCKELILAGIIGGTLYLSLSAFAEYWGIAFLNQVNGANHTILSAEMNSMVFLGWLVGGPISGWLSDRMRTRRTLLIVGNVIAAAMIALLLIWPSMEDGSKFLLLFLFGLFSSVEIICFSIATDILPAKFSATGLGVVNLFIMLAGMIFQPLIGSIVDFLWQGQLSATGMRVYSMLDYQHALIVIPVFMLLAALLAYFLKETYPKEN